MAVVVGLWAAVAVAVAGLYEGVAGRVAVAVAHGQAFVIHRTQAYPFWPRPLQLGRLSTGIDRTRTMRGAVCGAVAAAVWALEQPLDKAVFSSGYDDVAVL